MKKIKIHSEVLYILAQLILTLAVAMMSAADFGLSMIVAPAYILSLKYTVFTFGQWTYIVQGVLFVVFCVCMKRFKPIYFISFITCVIYGTILDMWRAIIPILNPHVTTPGSMDIAVRIFLFATGELLAAVAVTLFFKSYIYPQVCDLFVKGIAEKYHINNARFKMIFDLICLILSIALALVLFGRFVGIKWGTVIITAFNGILIGFFTKVYDKYFETLELFPRFATKFKL